MATGSVLGAPLDLLAHWVYRQACLRRDVIATRETLRKFELDTFMRETFPDSFHDCQHELACYEWLSAEAEYWAIRLDLEATAQLGVSDRIGKRWIPDGSV